MLFCTTLGCMDMPNVYKEQKTALRPGGGYSTTGSRYGSQCVERTCVLCLQVSQIQLCKCHLEEEKEEKRQRGLWVDCMCLCWVLERGRVTGETTSLPPPGIPTLILLDLEGSVITRQGRAEVLNDLECRFFPWLPRPVLELSEANAVHLNEGPCLVLFVGERGELLDVPDRSVYLYCSHWILHVKRWWSDRAAQSWDVHRTFPVSKTWFGGTESNGVHQYLLLCLGFFVCLLIPFCHPSLPGALSPSLSLSLSVYFSCGFTSLLSTSP